MRHTDIYHIIFVVIALSVTVSCRHRNDVSKDIPADENTEADFGTIREKDGLAHANLLYLNNTGDTLHPIAAYTHCTCVSADTDRQPVAPGETLKIAVTYNPAYRSGIFMEEVGVKCLGRKGILSFIIKGEIVPMKHPVTEDCPYSFGKGIHISHETLHFGEMEAGKNRKMFIRCANSGRKNAEIDFSVPEKYRGTLSFRKDFRLRKNGRDTLWFSFTMPEGIPAPDTLTFPVQVSVNGRHTDKTLTIKAISAKHEETQPLNIQ